jgi:hypothetical protein
MSSFLRFIRHSDEGILHIDEALCGFILSCTKIRLIAQVLSNNQCALLTKMRSFGAENSAPALHFENFL